MNKKRLKQKLKEVNEQIDTTNVFIKRCMVIYYRPIEYDPDTRMCFPDERMRNYAWTSAENMIKMRAEYMQKAERIKELIRKEEEREKQEKHQQNDM